MNFRLENKEYGYWLLGRLYKKTVILSLLISSIIVFLIFFLPMVIIMTKEYTQPIRVKPIHVIAEMTEIPVVPDLPEIESEIKEKDVSRHAKIEAVIDLPEQNEELVDSLELKNEFENRIATEQDIITEKPAFVCGGDFSVFRQWFVQNFRMPSKIYLAKGETKIVVKFEVNTLGKIDSISVMNTIDPILSAQVRATLMESPVWGPCVYKGKTIRQVYVLPIKLVKQRNDE